MPGKKLRPLFFVTTFLFPAVFVQAQQINPFNYSIQKKITCYNGAVVCAHPLASKVGKDILKQGGNAFDAAIAMQLTLAVVYPGAGNIGGGGFLVGHLKNGKNIAIDFRETAPGAARRDMYLDSSGKPIADLSKDGYIAAGVPGTVAGLFASLRYAKLPFKKLIQPSIDLAAKGFAITANEATALNNEQAAFLRLNKTPIAFVKEGGWKAGDTLVQPELAATLIRIRDFGRKDFYEGATATMIVNESKKSGGIINYNDLKNYKAIERNPIVFTYNGYRIITTPLPSSGGILLQQMMGMIGKRKISTLKFQTAASVQLMVETERRAYADRAEFMGDPAYVKVPVKFLTSDQYLQERMKNYQAGKAGSSDTTKAGIIPQHEETTHISIIDKDGNAVAVTTTLNGRYGCRTVVSGAGFFLNNEMDDFSIKPGEPNMYGAIGNEQNAIAPGKRMLSSITATIVTKNNQPFLVVGTPGGTTIPTSVYQTLVNVLEFGMTPEAAVNKPKFHHQWLPDEIFVETDFDPTTKRQLEEMGYKVTTRSPIGRVELIKIEGKKITAVGDSRGDDAAEGY